MRYSEETMSQTSNRKNSVHILLAEDNPFNQKLAEILFTSVGYTLAIADNGQEAFEKYTAYPNNFDLILMDIQMPEMDGIESAKAIRKWEDSGDSDKIRRIPIIAMSASTLTEDKEKCIEAGMDAYLVKPIKKESVHNLLEKWITS
jgi:CheY-like chemotaxis protein